MRLEDFAEIYISTALSLARENLDSELFDKQLIEQVSAITNISKQKIIKIHHPFYWALFDEDIKLKPNSIPMEYVLENPTLLKLEDSKVSLDRELNDNFESKQVIMKLISDYKEYIQSNVRCFQ